MKKSPVAEICNVILVVTSAPGGEKPSFNPLRVNKKNICGLFVHQISETRNEKGSIMASNVEPQKNSSITFQNELNLTTKKCIYLLNKVGFHPCKVTQKK